MNKQQLTQYLTSFKKWFKANKAQAVTEQLECEQLAVQVKSYTEERLQNMLEEELFDYIVLL